MSAKVKGAALLETLSNFAKDGIETVKNVASLPTLKNHIMAAGLGIGTALTGTRIAESAPTAPIVVTGMITALTGGTLLAIAIGTAIKDSAQQRMMTSAVAVRTAHRHNNSGPT